MNEITAIIPFLNEGEEVFNTVDSLMEFSERDFPIIVINDGSTDNYDYSKLKEKKNVVYIENKERLGVAASRDFGISICRTPYFILLDAHMRFYKKGWEKIFIEELKKDDRQILCGQTRFLHKKDGVLIDSDTVRFGCKIHLENNGSLMNVYWKREPTDGENKYIEDVPCILGASYVASKRYWNYLRGLEGLRFYGSDEQFISIKAWREGGRCRLIKNVVIGHIFRDKFPYELESSAPLYNKLLIAELMMSPAWKNKIFSWLKTYHSKNFEDAFLKLTAERKEIEKYKKYLDGIFTRDFEFVVNLNNPEEYIEKIAKYKRIKPYLQNLLLSSGVLENIGLMNGKTGLVILLFLYGKTFRSSGFEDAGEKILDSVFEDCNPDTPLGFENGLCGIGWGLEYLVQHKLMDCDPDFLDDLDELVMQRDLRRISDFSLETGLGGILLYVLSRLKGKKGRKEKKTFDRKYLKELYMAVNKMISGNETYGLLIERALEYTGFYLRGEISESPVNFTDYCRLPEWGKCNEKRYFSIKSGMTGMLLNAIYS